MESLTIDVSLRPTNSYTLARGLRAQTNQT